MIDISKTPQSVLDKVSTVITIEDGYVNNPDDSGGETCYGITRKTLESHKDIWSEFNFSGDMQNMPINLAVYIYVTEFYYQHKLDLLEGVVSDRIISEIFDTGVNSHPKTAVRMLQRALNLYNNKQKYYPDLTVDGFLGSKTVEAYKALEKIRGDITTSKLIFNTLNILQGCHFITLAEHDEKDETFIFGWIMNRLEFE